ncbi:MAG: peptidyl-prolyl cis-trans isomerase, partial [Deltaproteobacteria bacterium]|nr:peptidyl-prolyl cis-trans isomerase [Deltaproteobacteria bacterium]
LKMRFSLYHLCCLLLLLSMFFCSACENRGQEVVATIGKQQITKKQLAARIQQYKTVFSHAAPQETVTPAELKRFFLDQIIDETLIAMEGRKRGLAVKEDNLEQLIRKTMIDLGRSISYPSRQEALEYYRKHKKNYLVHKRYETTQILVVDEHLAWELKEKIEKHQLSMEEAARKYSIGEEASQGGHLQAMKLNDFLPEIAKIIPRLKPAQVSPVIHSPYGYHLLRLEHILPAGFETFSEVENKVKDELYTLKLRNHFSQWLAEARVRYQVSIQASQLEAVNEK